MHQMLVTVIPLLVEHSNVRCSYDSNSGHESHISQRWFPVWM